MESYQQRVVDEAEALSVKLDNLLAFFHSPIYQTLPDTETDRLNRQATHMSHYLVVLRERIAAF